MCSVSPSTAVSLPFERRLPPGLRSGRQGQPLAPARPAARSDFATVANQDATLHHVRDLAAMARWDDAGRHLCPFDAAAGSALQPAPFDAARATARQDSPVQ